jgi:hypothetical protein
MLLFEFNVVRVNALPSVRTQTQMRESDAGEEFDAREFVGSLVLDQVEAGWLVENRRRRNHSFFFEDP